VQMSRATPTCGRLNLLDTNGPYTPPYSSATDDNNRRTTMVGKYKVVHFQET